MPPQQPPPQASLTLLLIFLFFFLSNNNTVPPPGFPGSPRDYAAAQVAHLRSSLAVLNSTQWGDFSPLTPGSPQGEPTRYLNLTGFREQDGYAWDRLDAFRGLCSDMTRGREVGPVGAMYENVTGIVTGRWVRYNGDLMEEQKHRRYNLSEISPGIDWAASNEEAWGRNITGSEGKLRMSIEEKEGKEAEAAVEDAGTGLERIREIKATLTIQDESSSGDGWDIMAHGVHWPEKGSMLLATTSDKFAGLFGLPHLTLNEDQFSSSTALLNRTLEKKIEEMEHAFWTEVGNPWPSSPDSPRDATMPSPHCELLVYVQVHPVKLGLPLNEKNPADPARVVHDIEQELRFPNGAPVSDIPPLRMSTTIFSPDCGFMLQSKGPPAFPSIEDDHLVGRKKEVYVHKVQSWMLIFAVVILGQLLLLKMQSKEASTPSTIGRVSLSTISMMLIADGMLFACMSLASATSGNIFPSALLITFAALMSVAIAVRFILAIYNVQEPERRERERLQMAAEEASRARTTQSPTSVTPASASNNTPIIIPSDQDIQAEIDQVSNAASAVPRPTLPTTNAQPTIAQPPQQSNFVTMYIRFVIGITFLLFLSLAALSWPVAIRSAYTNTLAFIYLSFWIPQIHRNVVRNCRKALLWKFVVGQSLLRLLPFAYFYLKKDNILFSEPDWTAFSILAGYLWIQILVLVAQGVLGPRYGVPAGWTEDAWDYHPILSEDNVEAGGMPIGLVQIPGSPTAGRSSGDEARKKTDGGVRTVDCAICMQVLEVPVLASGEDPAGPAAGGVAGILARRLYMVTPCRHVFHSACLEGWMRFRLQCPICRENLPPL